MTIKDSVQRALERAMGASISGEDLAKSLSVSRNAVWKAVKELQDEGFIIDAASHRGYCLTGRPDLISAECIARHLPAAHPFRISVCNTITSTNTVLKSMAEKGAPEGTVLIAEEQTAGKGRMNRSFYSPAGTGIYISVLLRPRFSAAESLSITTAAAVAVAEAVEQESGRETKIKWVNDVYCSGKKLCGILTEAAFDMETRGLAYAVLGIGINVQPPCSGFPQELEPIVTSVWTREEYQGDRRNRLAADVLTRFWRFYERLTEKPFLASYQQRSLLNDTDVVVLSGETARAARALEIDDDCRLHVRYDDGTEEYLCSGEVSVKPCVRKEP